MRPAFLLPASLFVSCIAAHADTYTTYYLDATYTNPSGAAISGNFTVDDSTSLVSAGSLTASGFPVGNGTYSADSVNVLHDGAEFADMSSVIILQELGGLGDPTIGLRVYLNTGTSSYDFVTTTNATTTPPAMTATPEPSSFALLGTGLIGAAGAIRRRFGN